MMFKIGDIIISSKHRDVIDSYVWGEDSLRPDLGKKYIVVASSDDEVAIVINNRRRTFDAARFRLVKPIRNLRGPLTGGTLCN